MSGLTADARTIEDAAMPFLALALDVSYMSRRLRSVLGTTVEVQSIRVTRWKPGRRCVIEYDVVNRAAPGVMTLVGKIRAKSFDRATYALSRELVDLLAGLRGGAFAVPPVRGALPECHMWLQDKVDGTSGWDAIVSADGAQAAHRIGCAAAMLHHVLPALSRSHSIGDEIRALRNSLQKVQEAYPTWNRRLRRVQQGCERIAADYRSAIVSGIHRDFYHDQVIVDRERVWLLDLDLAANGDPSQDIGNFVAHLTEQSLRLVGNSHALTDVEKEFVYGFHTAGGVADPQVIEVWKTLTLARHVYLTTRFETRRPFTEAILTFCEERLQL